MKAYEAFEPPRDSYEPISVNVNVSVNPARAIKELRETLAIAQVVAQHRKAGRASAEAIINATANMLEMLKGF